MNCKICDLESPEFSRAKVLKKYDIKYFRCNHCGFIQTEEPYWIDEAYSDVINRSDIGLVSRSITFCRIVKVLVFAFFNRNVKFIDYAGGYGLFVRMMRDIGFDFYHYDKYCPNLFAQDFESKSNGSCQYELLTAFEVFEHLASPIDEIQEMLSFSRNILFTTQLVPANTPMPNDWWYYGLDHGQHVSFYSQKSLSIIAEKFNLNIYSNGRSFHLLAEKKISPFLFNVLSRHKVAALVNMIFNQKSLIQADYKKVTRVELK
ncbi:MAG: Methyltransferase type 11 [Candidatus Jettenia ecosi]|uniref:Methyltransferase type 11 n=1 Tax=Candidatus Jettenia ecosi TaxID=2494326 RepID=A0A533QBZ4_9BACT|nr:MAG: Methyltransferase type 11 [Candidatus Jettenia ecosi]